MKPSAVVVLLWLVFGGSHIGLAMLRGRIVRRIGEVGFVALFYIVAAVSFAALVTYYADHRFEGAAGLALGSIPILRWILMAAAGLGLVLLTPALLIYPSLPTALFGQPIRSVRGIERVTRHPFFAGTCVFAVAHMLLAPHLVGAAFFGGLAALSGVGTWHQDRKILERRGAPYAEYLQRTSTVPFGAVLAGRQTFAWNELPLGALAAGALGAMAARYWHDSLFADGGWWIVAVVLVGSLVAGGNAYRRSRRLAVRSTIASASHGLREGSSIERVNAGR